MHIVKWRMRENVSFDIIFTSNKNVLGSESGLAVCGMRAVHDLRSEIKKSFDIEHSFNLKGSSWRCSAHVKSHSSCL